MTANAQIVTPRNIEILLVEDNPGDIVLTREAFRMADIGNSINIAEDGELAITYLDKVSRHDPSVPRPDIILLDLNLPRRNGREVLEHVKQHESLRRIPVIVLTTSDLPEDINDSYNRHANSYITKPLDMRQFMFIVSTIKDFWFGASMLPRT
ncbi:Response regulator rcp1 [Hartmannibacter diazotrophicus]|uniref:Response regulator rcp1 n=1 Tax=Hartmannibacter diazotrophicus TaxID=1482074 RepID=A0A2C9DBM6_9HYPH|nr:response regulator [Hartmannibacter diazotrophicus]SON57707.1 Response regulator rcp1 [Hartmannibacter diazotrophicus]